MKRISWFRKSCGALTAVTLAVCSISFGTVWAAPEDALKEVTTASEEEETAAETSATTTETTTKTTTKADTKGTVPIVTEEADATTTDTEAEAEAAEEEEATAKKWKKARLSEYADSLFLVDYEMVDEEEAKKLQTVGVGQVGVVKQLGEIATSMLTYPCGIDVPYSMAPYVDYGYFAFTTYGWGHGCGMSQNGANHYAMYAGYDYQQILFHYYPGTTLVQTEIPAEVTAGGRTGSVLDIVSMIVFNEMSSTMDDEAMKAQAVAAYTYIMNPHGIHNSMICKDNPPQNVIDAVQSVLGQALYYEDEFALTVYGASSGGYTATADDVFGGDGSYPYLVSVPCEYDAYYDPHYGDVAYFTVDELRYALQSAYGFYLSDNYYDWISLEFGDGGYVKYVTIDGERTISGNDFASVLGLKSPRFNYVVG